MDIASYQRWLADYDCQRSFDLTEMSQVTVHLMEEVGEIAREVLYLEGYKNPNEREDGVGRLSEEIGDALVFLTKLAIHYGLDLETIVANGMTKAESRWLPDHARSEMARYIEHQHATNSARRSTWAERNGKPSI